MAQGCGQMAQGHVQMAQGCGQIEQGHGQVAGMNDKAVVVEGRGQEVGEEEQP